MAEEAKEKKEKKDELPASVKDPVAFAIALIIIVILLERLLARFTGTGSGLVLFGPSGWFVQSGLYALWEKVSALYLIMIWILSLFFIIMIIYTSLKTYRIDIEWRKSLYPKPEDGRVETMHGNKRWDMVVAHVQSDNPSDWRLAILEADIILDELLDHLGYVGDTIGDKLKSADNSRFRTLNDAWEAHKVRNTIAHEGHEYVLTQRESQRVIALYRNVFREFDYI